MKQAKKLEDVVKDDMTVNDDEIIEDTIPNDLVHLNQLEEITNNWKQSLDLAVL